MFNSLIPKITYHLRQCNKVAQISLVNETDIVKKAYSLDQIHCGIMFNDTDDEIYLKNLFESILHLSLPENQRNSR